MSTCVLICTVSPEHMLFTKERVLGKPETHTFFFLALRFTWQNFSKTSDKEWFGPVEQIRKIIDGNSRIIFISSPWRGNSNEYPQHMFLWRNKQNYPLIITKYAPDLFHWIWLILFVDCVEKWTSVLETLQSLLHLCQLYRLTGLPRNALCYLREGLRISQAQGLPRW